MASFSILKTNDSDSDSETDSESDINSYINSNFIKIDNPGNPHCWYHCISFILNGSFEGEKFRKEIGLWLRDNQEFFTEKNGFLNSDIHKSHYQYIMDLEDGAWVDNIAICATAQYLFEKFKTDGRQTPIVIIYDEKQKNFIRSGVAEPVRFDEIESLYEIDYVYFIHYNGSHYQNLIKTEKKNSKPDLFTPRSYDHVLPDSKSSKCSKSTSDELDELYNWL